MQINNNKTDTPKKTFVILSCDGGGVRALLQHMFFEQLAKDVGSPIAKFIDLATFCSGGAICGTSILASEDGINPYFTEERAKEAFQANCEPIFPQQRNGFFCKIFNKFAPPALSSVTKTLWKIISQNGLYSSDNQRKVIESQFGEMKAKDTIVPFFIPTTDFRTGTPVWLTNLKGFENSHLIRGNDKYQGERTYYVPEMKLADILLASIRPPILFGSRESTILYQEKDENGIYQDHSLEIDGTDGAIYAGSPERDAYDQALEWCENVHKLKRDEYRIILLSVGSGRRLINNEIGTVRKSGIIKRLKALINRLETTIDCSLVLPYRAGQNRLHNRLQRNGDIYLRFDATIDGSNPDNPSINPANAHPENLAKFQRFVDDHFINGENKEEYEFTVNLCRKIVNDECIEELVAQRLGEKYAPLCRKQAVSVSQQITMQQPKPKKGGLLRRIFPFLSPAETLPSANQNIALQEKTNPPLSARSGFGCRHP